MGVNSRHVFHQNNGHEIIHHFTMLLVLGRYFNCTLIYLKEIYSEKSTINSWLRGRDVRIWNCQSRWAFTIIVILCSMYVLCIFRILLMYSYYELLSKQDDVGGGWRQKKIYAKAEVTLQQGLWRSVEVCYYRMHQNLIKVCHPALPVHCSVHSLLHHYYERKTENGQGVTLPNVTIITVSCWDWS